MLFKKIKMSIAEAVAQENAIAKVERNEADIEYIAMMTDVELEAEEETNNVE